MNSGVLTWNIVLGWHGGQQCPLGPVKDGPCCWYAVWSVPLLGCATKTPTAKPGLVGSTIPSIPALSPVLAQAWCWWSVTELFWTWMGVVPLFARNGTEPLTGWITLVLLCRPCSAALTHFWFLNELLPCVIYSDVLLWSYSGHPTAFLPPKRPRNVLVAKEKGIRSTFPCKDTCCKCDF